MPFPLRCAETLCISLFVILSIYPQSLFSQIEDENISKGLYDGYRRAFQYPEKPHKRHYYINGMKIINHSARMGFVSALNTNVHDAHFSNLPFIGWNTLTPNRLNTSEVFPARLPIGYAAGVFAEIPLVPEFAMGLRLMAASHNASIPISAVRRLDVTLTTLGIEMMGMYNFDEHWRGYLGCAFSGINSKTYSEPFSGTNIERELPQAALLMFAPLLGVGYDMPLGTHNPEQGRWILTPEIIGTVGMSQVLTGLRLDEYWLLSQIRIGFALKYEWASEEEEAPQPRRYFSPLVPIMLEDSK
jgi:hypothetical protein